MPDACDRMVDMQLKIADEFGAKRVLKAVVVVPLFEDCVSCGDPITPERLEAEPMACRCICCQTLFESHGSKATWKPVTY